MTTGCTCHQTSGYCQCLVADSQCVAWSYDDGYQARFVIDPAAGNIVDEGPVGLRALLGRTFTNPESAGVYRVEDENITVPGGTIVRIPFDTTLWDTEGSFDAAENVRRVGLRRGGVYAMHMAITWLANDDVSNFLYAAVHVPVTGQAWANVVRHPAQPRGNYQNAFGIEYAPAGAYVEAMAFVSSVDMQLLAQGVPFSASVAMARLGSLS